MNFLLFHLKRLLSLPFRIFLSPKEMVSSLWSESGRSRALLLGLPAILFAILGVGILLWAKFGVADSLENRYLTELENTSESKLRLVTELRREMRMLQASQQTGSSGAKPTSLIPKDDPRLLELEGWQGKEKIYLEKLIDLNPEESEYLFQLALVAYEKRDINRCLALMNLTAPLDEPGFIKGHLWLASYHMNSSAKSSQEANQNVMLALEHAEQCLKRDQGNQLANEIKAALLMAQGRNLEEAYEIFNDLFETDPKFYQPMVRINKQVNRPDRNELVYESAIERFDRQLKNESFDVAEEIRIWRDLTSCYLQRKQYETAEQRLLKEIQRQSELKEGSGRVWAERMLSNVYLAWTSTVDEKAPNAEAQQLAFLKKAYRYYTNNSDVLRHLTRLSVSSDPTVASEALSIYDALKDPDAPALVLNEIGSHALGRSDYNAALRYFEMARKKKPQNPEILNNLAYTYIVGTDPNPKRGLTLVDEALRRLPNEVGSRRYLTFFRDTRGQALMQLNRWTEAAADFEFALLTRPNNKKILESLIKCYRASGLDPSAYVERLRIANEEEQGDAPAAEQGNPTTETTDSAAQTSGQ